MVELLKLKQNEPGFVGLDQQEVTVRLLAPPTFTTETIDKNWFAVAVFEILVDGKPSLLKSYGVRVTRHWQECLIVGQDHKVTCCRMESRGYIWYTPCIDGWVIGLFGRRRIDA